MPLTNNVTRMLLAKGVAYETHELPAEKLGGLEAAAYLGVNAKQMFKTIVAIRSQGRPVLALIPATAQLDLKALSRGLGGPKLQTATQAQAEKLTGLQVGGISPLALIGKGFEVVLDESAMRFEKIYLSGGQRGLNITLAPQALVALTRAKVITIGEG
jgi:Cys-tRNA(Pro)/Cys-tRNA(Cys) deacylase